MRRGRGVLNVRRAGIGAPRTQNGFGLVEILICVFLVSTVTLALVAGLLTQLRASDTTSRRQEVDLALANYAEHVRSLDYEGCAPTDVYEAYVPPTGMSAQIVQVEHWHKGPRSGAGELQPGVGFFGPSCYVDGSGQHVDDGAVRLTLRVEQGEQAAETQVVKVR